MLGQIYFSVMFECYGSFQINSGINKFLFLLFEEVNITWTGFSIYKTLIDFVERNSNTAYHKLKL